MKSCRCGSVLEKPREGRRFVKWKASKGQGSANGTARERPYRRGALSLRARV